MKALKKLTAIVLAVCMLIGMPLSIDVSAVNSSNDVTELKLLQVMPYIADPRYANVGPTNADNDPARFMFVIFNSITANNGKAGSDIRVVDSNGAIIRDENNKEVILKGEFKGGLMPTAWNKPLGWMLYTGQSFSNKTINNFFDVKELLASDYYAQKGAKMVFRVWETSVEAADGKIADYYCNHDNSILLNGSDVLTISGVKRDGLKKDVSWNPVTFTKAQAISDTVIRLSFSEPIMQNAGGTKDNLYVAIRIVDTENNDTVVSNGNGGYYQYPSLNWSYHGGNELVWNSPKPISEIQAICDQLNADQNTDKYKVKFCLEEKNNLSEKHGEVQGNGYVDTLWAKATGVPVSGTTMPNRGTNDGVLCEITPVEELKKANMTIESATTVSRRGMADRIAVTFSDPVNSIPGTSWIRVFDSTDTLRFVDEATEKLTSGTDGKALQWKVDGWSKASEDGKVWIATLNKNLDCDTYQEILTYMSGITDTEGKEITSANGYKIQLAFLDNGGTKISGNGLIDTLKSADGTKKLYAANVQNLGEERAVCELSESLSVTDVSVYADKYVIFTFSEDIKMDAASLAKINANKFYLGAHTDIVKGSDPVQDKDGHIHSRLSSAKQYGKAGNKLLMTMESAKPWSSIKARKEAYEKNKNTTLTYAIRVEGGGRAQATFIDGIVSADGNLKLYRSNPDVGWGGRSYYPVGEGSVIKIDSIHVLDAHHAEIRFVDGYGDPIEVTKQNYNPGGSVYTAIRLIKDGKLVFSNKCQINTAATGEALQFTSSMATKNGTMADSTWVLTCDKVNLYDLMQAVNDENGYLGKNGVDMALGLEGGTANGEMAGYIDNFTSVDGKAILKFTSDTDASQQHRYFYAFLPDANTWTAAESIPETVKIEKVEAINNGVLQVTFDQAVNINTQGWTGLRIVDGVNSVMAFEDDKTTVMGNVMSIGEKNLGMIKTNFAKADADGKVWNFTLNGAIHGHYGFTDIFNFVESLPKTGEKWVGELKLALILEESGDKKTAPDNVKNNGVTDRVVAADGSGAKLVNNQMGKDIGDGSCIEITADILSKFDPANPLTVTSAKQINKKQLLVTFSEAVTIGDPYMAIRYVDENNELIFANRDKNGNTIKDPKMGGKALQYASTKWEWNNDAHTEIVVTFNHDIGVILDGSNLPASLSPMTNPDYSFKFVIEEKNPEKHNDASRNAMVCAIAAAGNADKKLAGNTKPVINSWDGHAVEITNVITPDTLITVSDAKITGENQVTFKWSHSVDLTNDKNYYAGFRYVNEETNVLYGNDKDGWMQFKAILTYTDSAMMEMTAHVTPNTKWGVFDLDDLLNPTGALKEYMDANPGKWIVRIEEKNGSNGNALIDTFFGKDGMSIQADPFVGNWADGVDIAITGTPITGELSVTGVEIISDTQVKVIFSAPVAYAQRADGKGDSTPYVAMRLYNKDSKLLFWNAYTQEYTTAEQMRDKDGKQVYKNQNGYTLEKEGYNAKGEWVPYAAQKNVGMQWQGTPTWGDDKHTTIIYQLQGGEHLPIQNITDILNYDFSVFGEGAFLGFDIEENTPAMIGSNGHVDNIVRADNAKIALDANFFPHSRDSLMITLDNIKIAYKPYKITSTTKIINETQIRVAFSQPVEIEHGPYMAIRMIDKEGNLMWNGEENISQAYQWGGTWEWEDDSHRAIIWTITGTTLGATTIYDLANWSGVLQKYKNEGTWMFVIEEKDAGDFKVGRYNNLVDNVVSKDGTVHLLSTYSKGFDGILTRLNVEDLVGPKVELQSAQALDDQTIKLTFSEAVAISETVSMGVRYLSASGDSDVLTDGKVAYFKGDWKYADENKNVIIWTLNSKNADNLTDIINYNGKFEWNKGSRVAFVIMDAEEERGTPKAMRINGIYDLTGFRKLVGNYATKDYPMTQMDIEVLYDIPAPEASGEQLSEVVYVTNYIPFIIASAVIALAGLAVAIILFKKRKKNEQ